MDFVQFALIKHFLHSHELHSNIIIKIKTHVKHQENYNDLKVTLK